MKKYVTVRKNILTGKLGNALHAVLDSSQMIQIKDADLAHIKTAKIAFLGRIKTLAEVRKSAAYATSHINLILSKRFVILTAVNWLFMIIILRNVLHANLGNTKTSLMILAEIANQIVNLAI